ncbi:MAG: crossover junction endodeoxyribonuclease RuvC [Bacteroidales bacterium]|nr:crossover junction endodeoxyribonuclease RuvC [Bacteroidales bacterium]
MSTIERIILGIDPGTKIMGYGIIRAEGKNVSLLDMGVFNFSKTPDHYVRLQQIFKDTLDLIDEYKPDELAIEAPFFGKNVQSMLKLGRAQGVAISAALSRQLPIFEYAPRKIKLAITGQGAASKEQVAGFLKSALGFKDIPKNLDATDGLAAAMCHFYQRNPADKGKSYSGWDDFLKKNPDRKSG